MGLGRGLLRRVRQPKHAVEHPGERHGIDQEKQQNAQVGQQGLPPGNAEPACHDRHQNQRQPTLKTQPVRQAALPGSGFD